MQRKIGYEIREFQQLMKHKIEEERVNDSIKLSHIQTHILLYLSNQNDFVFQRDIEKELGVRRSTATEMLNVLERDGMIIREKVDFDARLKLIKLTDKAKGYISFIDARIKKIEMLLRKGIDESSLNIFFDVLDKIKGNLR